jgi:hypothetical protein
MPDCIVCGAKEASTNKKEASRLANLFGVLVELNRIELSTS